MKQLYHKDNASQKDPRQIAVIMAGIVVGIILLSLLFGGDSKPERTSGKTALNLVKTEQKAATTKVKTAEVYGVTEASQHVDLKAEVEGKVIAIPGREGFPIKEGDIILEIEKRGRDARFAEAQAFLKQRQIEYASAKGLALRGLQADVKLAESASNLEEAKKEMIQAKIDLDNTVIRAPFGGYLEKVNVDVGALVGPNIRTGQGSFNDGDAICTVLNTNPFLTVGYVSENIIQNIKPGTIAEIHLADGTKTQGTVTFAGKIANPSTRTFRVEAEVTNPDYSVASGITARMIIPLDEQDAHYIPSSALALNASGTLGIMIFTPEDLLALLKDEQSATTLTDIDLESTMTRLGVTEDAMPETPEEVRKILSDKGIALGHVHFTPVTIFDQDAQGIWVTGLPDTFQLVTVGQSFVQDGELTAIREPHARTD